MAANRVFRVYPDEETMLRIYQDRLSHADQKFHGRESELERMWERYENIPVTDTRTSRGHLVTNTAGTAIIDTMFSSMTAVDVEYITKRIGVGTKEQELAATAGLNQAWKDTKGQRRAKKAVKDALIADIGWVKVYYDYVEDVAIEDVPEEAALAQIQAVKDREGLGDDDGDYDEATAIARREGLLEQEVEVVVRDRICLDYVPYDMIRYDTTAEQIEDVRWVCQYTDTPTLEVRNNPQYRAFVEDRYGKRKGRKMLADLEGDAVAYTGTLQPKPAAHELGGGGDSDDTDDLGLLRLCEMWDFETGLVTIFPHGQTELVLYQRTNPLMFNVDLEDRNPFKPLVVRDVKGRLEGAGDMRILMPALEELDEYRTNLAQYVERFVPKIAGPEDAMTQEGKKALASREYGEYVALGANHSGQELQVLQPPPFPQEAFQVIERLMEEMQDATGASEVLRGVFTTKRQTAVETERVASAGERRQAERRSALEQWYLDIARTMLQLMQKFYDRDRMMRTTNDLGEEFVWEWNAQDIAIEADIEIALTPVERLTRDERLQRWLQIANLLLPMPETSIPHLEQAMLRDFGLSEEEITELVKTPEEVELEEQSAMVSQQLAAAPAAGSGAPGLELSPGGGGAPA